MRTRSRTFALLASLVAVLALAAACAGQRAARDAVVSSPDGQRLGGPALGRRHPGPTASPAETSAAPSSSPASAPPTATPTPAPTASPTPAPSGTTIVRAYFMLGSFTDNSGLAPSCARSRPPPASPRPRCAS
ncbi:MAG: hypothetical protein U0838_15895 [Chloroflexota bacterium]